MNNPDLQEDGPVIRQLTEKHGESNNETHIAYCLLIIGKLLIEYTEKNYEVFCKEQLSNNF